MKKHVVFALAALTVLLMLTGCAKPAPKEFLIDSKNYFEIGVPSGSKVFFQAPWYRVSTQDYLEDSGSNAREFTVGQDAELSGVNVDQLNGAHITVRENDLSECVNTDYYKNIALQSFLLQGITPERNLAGDVRSRDVAKVRNALKGYVAHGKILSLNLSFYGEITKDVQIDSISINSIYYHASFDSFHITPLAIPDNQSDVIYEKYITGGDGGLLSGPSMSQSGYCLVEGAAQSAIRNIRVEAVNDSCVVLDQTNYREFAAYCDTFSESTMNGQKAGPFRNGDAINLEFAYLYLGKTPEEFKQYDSAIACLRYIYTLEDGTELNSYIYQTSLLEPEYVLVRLLLNDSK